MKRKLFIIIPAAIIGAGILLPVLFFLFLTIVEYKPAQIESVPFTTEKKMLLKDQLSSLKAQCSFNC